MDSKPKRTASKRARWTIDYNKIYGCWKLTGKARSFPGKHSKYESICIFCGRVDFRIKYYLQQMCSKCIHKMCFYFKCNGKPVNTVFAIKELTRLVPVHIRNLSDPNYAGPEFPLARGVDELHSLLSDIRQLLLSADGGVAGESLH